MTISMMQSRRVAELEQENARLRKKLEQAETIKQALKLPPNL